MSNLLPMDDVIEALSERLNLKARSLLVTVWGDSVAPHGGTVWLGSLIDLVKCLGLNERVVRTSVFRLKQDKLLDSHQAGRRSFYTLTKTGQHRFEEATRRIYNYTSRPWSGGWTLLFTERRNLSDEQKRQLQMELSWLGFGDLGSGIYAHPGDVQAVIDQLLMDLNLKSHVAVLSANDLPDANATPVHILVQKGWDVAGIESGYTDFIETFDPILERLKADQPLDTKKCFILRTLLVHDYRRALLKDPMLPDQLLPDKWSGHLARELFRDIYHHVWQGAESHLMQTLETTNGRLPEASEEFLSRFGGLER